MTKSAKNTDTAVNAARDGQVTVDVSSVGGVDIAMVDPSGNAVSNGLSTVTVPGVGAVCERCDRDRAVPVVMLRTVRTSVSPEFGLVARN